MKIKTIRISNFVGLEEFKYDAGDINIFEGPKGSGKSSILEALEKTVANIGRRTELVKHGEEEATLYIETSEGIEIDRRIRTEKADYLKIKKEGQGVKSTEAELRKLINGDIFRPLDFIGLDAKKQTDIILGMIDMNYTPDEIIKWFGGVDILSNINTSKHLLQVLKDIEVKNYEQRQATNRDIKTLEAQIRGIEKELPKNYDGNYWQALDLQELYKIVSDAQQKNNYIEQARQLQSGFEETMQTIDTWSENEIGKADRKFEEEKTDIKDLIELSSRKIIKAELELSGINSTLEVAQIKRKSRLEKECLDLDLELQSKIKDLQAEYENYKNSALKSYESDIQELTESAKQKEAQEREIIEAQKIKIATKEAEIEAVDSRKEITYQSIEKERLQKIEQAKDRIGKASKYLQENEIIDIRPLQQKADECKEMQGYLREWQRAADIRNGKLAELMNYSAQLTCIIETARNKPSELLKMHKLPLEGIAVDEKGLIRINGTLLDGLSSGEQLEAAFKIALQRIGELRIMCLDGFEKLNESEQIKVIKLCEENDIQAFITITKDTESGKMIIKEGL